MTEIPLIASLHLIVGATTVMAGAGALVFRKGSLLHRTAGNVFFAAMLALCTSGLYMSITRSITFTFFLGMLSLYLVLTGWVAALRKDGRIGRFEKAAFMAILLNSAALTALGCVASFGWWNMGDEVPPSAYFVLAGLAALFAAFDFHAIIRRGLNRKQRVTRHLWRMCFSMFIATSIFFLGNNDLLPDALRTPLFLNAPIFAILLAMIFWIFRIQITRPVPVVSDASMLNAPQSK